MLLKSCCWNCGHLRITTIQRKGYHRKLQLLLRGHLAAAARVDLTISKGVDEAGLDSIETEPFPDEDEPGGFGAPLTSNILSEIQVRSLFRMTATPGVICHRPTEMLFKAPM